MIAFKFDYPIRRGKAVSGMQTRSFSGLSTNAMKLIGKSVDKNRAVSGSGCLRMCLIVVL